MNTTIRKKTNHTRFLVRIMVLSSAKELKTQTYYRAIAKTKYHALQRGCNRRCKNAAINLLKRLNIRVEVIIKSNGKPVTQPGLIAAKAAKADTLHGSHLFIIEIEFY